VPRFKNRNTPVSKNLYHIGIRYYLPKKIRRDNGVQAVLKIKKIIPEMQLFFFIRYPRQCHFFCNLTA
jgi:hypothetical protein